MANRAAAMQDPLQFQFTILHSSVYIYISKRSRRRICEFPHPSCLWPQGEIHSTFSAEFCSEEYIFIYPVFKCGTLLYRLVQKNWCIVLCGLCKSRAAALSGRAHYSHAFLATWGQFFRSTLYGECRRQSATKCILHSVHQCQIDKRKEIFKKTDCQEITVKCKHFSKISI